MPRGIRRRPYCDRFDLAVVGLLGDVMFGVLQIAHAGKVCPLVPACDGITDRLDTVDHLKVSRGIRYIERAAILPKVAGVHIVAIVWRRSAITIFI